MGNGSFRSTCDHDIGVAVLNHAAGLADAMQAGGARSGNRDIGPFKAKAHGHMASGHIDNRGGDEKRRNAPRTPRGKFDIGVLDHGQAADARTDDATNARSLLFTQRLPSGEACVLHRLRRCDDAVVDEAIHGARVLGANVAIQVQATHLAGNAAGKGTCVKFAD